MKYWFKAKDYGWGWYPSSIEGWIVLALYIGINIWNFLRIDSQSHSASDTLLPFVIQAFFVTLLLIFICFKKGERPRWRWGKQDSQE
jgi:hypothetical protein